MEFKNFQKVIFYYNFLHYGIKSSIFYKKHLNEKDLFPVNIKRILNFSYKNYGFNKTMITNLNLFIILILFLFFLDIFLSLSNIKIITFLTNMFILLILLRKFDIFQKNKNKHDRILILLYLIISYIFKFYWGLTLIFIILFENLIAFFDFKKEECDNDDFNR